MTEDFLMEKQTIYEMEYVFNLKDFIDFMMIQYNVNAKIESDEISEKETRKWMQDTLRFFFSFPQWLCGVWRGVSSLVYPVATIFSSK